MDVDIRQMTIVDYDKLLALWESVGGIGLHPNESDSREGISRYLAHNPGLSLVARDGSKLIGTVLCGSDGRRGYLNHLVVAREYHRRGVATALVARCMVRLKQMGIARCNLFVFEANAAGMAFWRKLGWQCYDEFGVKVMSYDIK